MEVARDSYNLNLLAKLTVLHHQMLFSPAIAVIAEAIVVRIGAFQALHYYDLAQGLAINTRV